MRFASHIISMMLVSVLLLGTINSSYAGPTLGISKARALQIAQARYPGKVIKIQAMPTHYRVRILQADGLVITIIVDGRTGRIIKDRN